MDKPLGKKTNELKQIQTMDYRDNTGAWCSLSLSLKKENSLRFNIKALLIFCSITLGKDSLDLRIEISPIAVTHINVSPIAVTNCSRIYMYIRYIDVLKMQKLNKDDKWCSLSKSDCDHCKMFTDWAMWKVSGLWDITTVNSVLNKNEYTLEAITKLNTFLVQNEESGDREMSLRRVQWDKKKKLILNKAHSLIVK
eukprot:792467_1